MLMNLNCANTDYSVGRVVLLFSLAPSTEVPQPRLMAYVQRFTAIPRSPSGTSGFYAVAKLRSQGAPRYEVITVSQIARLCPLAPVMEGQAHRDVASYDALDHYEKFYINKYRTPHDFAFLHFQ
jgi:hypothetical protein